MTNPDYTAIMLVVDRSGSMDLIRHSAQDTINEFIHGQKTEPGKRTIRIAHFDEEYETVCPSTPVAEMEPFQLSPRNVTALLDAMGRSITEFAEELAALPEPEQPAKVVLVVMTDGKENASVEYELDQVKELVQRQQTEHGWQILFLGANMDAVEVGTSMGVRRGQTMSYRATDYGTRSMGRAMGQSVNSYAAGSPADFTDEQRSDAASQ